LSGSRYKDRQKIFIIPIAMHPGVTRSSNVFSPDPTRIIARFLYLSDERSLSIIRKVLAMPEKETESTLNRVLRRYARRHRNITSIFEKNFEKISPLLQKIRIKERDLSPAQKTLIGSYFTMEYSIESAALFNPSIIEHPDQSELKPFEKRVIFSFRATGEGHISSIVFRAGVFDRNNNLKMEPAGKLLAEAERIKQYKYNKKLFLSKLEEMQRDDSSDVPEIFMKNLGNVFTYNEVINLIAIARKYPKLTPDQLNVINQIMWLASSHLELYFSLDSVISERVIFPIAQTEKNGIEDARFVRFKDNDNEVTYYGTYTAYDGTSILPKLISTKDFYSFSILPLNGEIVQNKGMALFPRRINGKYVMLCRIDGFNNYIAYSKNINIWREARLLQQPKRPWELVQMGNAGSPIETEDGWLVITHAVGPMREYSLGASLLQLDNPETELGRLINPLMVPNEAEREGYVPNVIYSCGSMVHNEDLIIAYAMSDHSSTYATIKIRELLETLKASKNDERKNR
jgi:beta-1,2-mannobiose phosphorylase / 1,2-beta-oligomannan phosphorylase